MTPNIQFSLQTLSYPISTDDSTQSANAASSAASIHVNPILAQPYPDLREATRSPDLEAAVKAANERIRNREALNLAPSNPRKRLCTSSVSQSSETSPPQPLHDISPVNPATNASSNASSTSSSKTGSRRSKRKSPDSTPLLNVVRFSQLPASPQMRLQYLYQQHVANKLFTLNKDEQEQIYKSVSMICLGSTGQRSRLNKVIFNEEGLALQRNESGIRELAFHFAPLITQNHFYIFGRMKQTFSGIDFALVKYEGISTVTNNLKFINWKLEESHSSSSLCKPWTPTESFFTISKEQAWQIRLPVCIPVTKSASGPVLDEKRANAIVDMFKKVSISFLDLGFDSPVSYTNSLN